MYKNMILEIKDKFFANGIILSFAGHFSQGIIEEIGEALRLYIEKDKNSKKISKKVFSVFIEQNQNIRSYEKSLSLEDAKTVFSSGSLLIGEENDKFIICSGNLIKKNDMPNLKKLLDTINSLDEDELKALYKQKLREEPKSDTGGAGLGFIEMKRQSTSPFEYDFIEKENDCYYFILIVKV